MGNTCDCFVNTSSTNSDINNRTYGEGSGMNRDEIRSTCHHHNHNTNKSSSPSLINEDRLYRDHSSTNSNSSSPALTPGMSRIPSTPTTPKTPTPFSDISSPGSFTTSSELSSGGRRQLMSPILKTTENYEENMWANLRKDLQQLDANLSKDTADIEALPIESFPFSFADRYSRKRKGSTLGSVDLQTDLEGNSSTSDFIGRDIVAEAEAALREVQDVDQNEAEEEFWDDEEGGSDFGDADESNNVHESWD